MASSSKKNTMTKEELEEDFSKVFLSIGTPLAGCSADDIYRIVGEVLDRSKYELNESWILGLFGYSGFDVLAFRHKIVALITGEDLTLLCIYFLTRGNNIERIIESTNSEMSTQRVKTLASTLDIKKVAKGKNQTVTLSRIAISFPESVALILHRATDFPGPITADDLRAATDFVEYPSLSRQPALACFLPLKHKDTTKILNVFMLANMMISETINNRNEEWNRRSDRSKFDTTAVYQKNALNSKLFSEEHRVKWCITFDILNADGKEYKTVWITAASKAAEKLRATYGESF